MMDVAEAESRLEQAHLRVARCEANVHRPHEIGATRRPHAGAMIGTIAFAQNTGTTTEKSASVPTILRSKN